MGAARAVAKEHAAGKYLIFAVAVVARWARVCGIMHLWNESISLKKLEVSGVYYCLFVRDVNLQPSKEPGGGGKPFRDPL